jgi:hypothetical protein
MDSAEDVRTFQFTSLPKVISPTTHAVIDWTIFAGTITTAYMFGKKNRVIGMSALMTAALEGLNVAFTKFPGGLFRKISFPSHGRMGLGNLPMFVALPALMGFAKRPESLFFYGQVALAALVIGMTDFNSAPADTHDPNRSDQLRHANHS